MRSSPFPTRKRIGFFLAFLLVSAVSSMGQVLISQEKITSAKDYGSGFGQSFLLPAGAGISAIELHIGSTGRGGGSAALRLWEATGSPGKNFTRKAAMPVATGLLDQQEVANTPGWFVFPLDQSYVNNSGAPVYLVFEVENLTSGVKGWNNYSFTDQDNYAGGHSVRWSSTQYSIRAGQDLAFRILGSEAPPGIPIPKMQVAVASNRRFVTIVANNSVEGYRYTCYRTNDFVSRRQLSSPQSGIGGPLVWLVPFQTGLPDREFYVVEVTPE